MAGRQQGHFEAANRRAFLKWDDVLVSLAWQARLHQPRGTFRQNDFIVRRDMIGMGVGHERERFLVPWIEPDVLTRQINATFVMNRNHAEKIVALPQMRECDCARD